MLSLIVVAAIFNLVISIEAVCERPVSPEHGTLHLAGDPKVGSLALYTCEPGWKLKGASASKCLNTRQWTSPPPTCIADEGSSTPTALRPTPTPLPSPSPEIKVTPVVIERDDTDDIPRTPEHAEEITCKELDETDLMKISYMDNLSVGSIANFHCFAPGIKSGVSRTQCLPNGEWSHSPPTCKKGHDCIQPSNPEHGRVSYSSLDSGSVLRYECDDGFVLSQHKQRTCTEDGTWSNTAPVCTEITCEIPLSPVHGTVQLTGNRQVGSTARYSCEDSRKPDGPYVSMCLTDGQWEFPPPKCIKDTCEIPLSPEHGTVQLSRYPPKQNSIAIYTCQEGRIMDGSSTSKCLDNGQWSLPSPKCLKNGCEMPPSPEYGTVQLSNYPPKVNTRASYSCEEGRTMVGESVSKCLIGGRWQFPPPKCVDLGDPK